MIAILSEEFPLTSMALVALGLFFLLVYSVAAIGLAYILGHSTITKGLREAVWGDEGEMGKWLSIRRLPIVLVECPACLGFWIGLATGWWIADSIPVISNSTIIVMLALYTSGSNLVLGKLTKIM